MDISHKLQEAMIDEYISVHPEKNPIAIAEAKSTEDLKYVIGQYTIFPKNIVSFLTAARNTARTEGWDSVAMELTRNIGEELGTETNGITHYDFLIRGIAEGLKSTSEDELRLLTPSEATTNFIEGILTITGSSTVAYAVGGAYALESSAVPELRIVQDLVNEWFIKETGLPIQEGDLKEFFRMHLDIWEPGHEENLRKASLQYLNRNETEYEQGFRDVMTTMDTWWSHLMEEVKLNYRSPS